MEFLKQNLDNSLILPFDILNDIYEYADPLLHIRKQIENKEYDLDDIMYKRMKRWILKDNELAFRVGILYVLRYNQTEYLINHTNIHKPELKEIILNAKNGYKDFFLWKHKRHTHICGLEPNFPLWYRKMMIKDLKAVNPDKNYYIMDIKQLYKLWKNL